MMKLIHPVQDNVWNTTTLDKIRFDLTQLKKEDPLRLQVQNFLSINYIKQFLRTASTVAYTRDFASTIVNPFVIDKSITYTMLRREDRQELLTKYRAGKVEMPTFIHYTKDNTRWLISGLNEYLFLTQFLRMSGNFFILQKNV